MSYIKDVELYKFLAEKSIEALTMAEDYSHKLKEANKDQVKIDTMRGLYEAMTELWKCICSNDNFKTHLLTSRVTRDTAKTQETITEYAPKLQELLKEHLSDNEITAEECMVMIDLVLECLGKESKSSWFSKDIQVEFEKLHDNLKNIISYKDNVITDREKFDEYMKNLIEKLEKYQNTKDTNILQNLLDEYRRMRNDYTKIKLMSRQDLDKILQQGKPEELTQEEETLQSSDPLSYAIYKIKQISNYKIIRGQEIIRIASLLYMIQ